MNIFKYNLQNKDITIEKLQSFSALLIEDTTKEVIELSKQLKKQVPLFPIIVITEKFENYPHLNPFHCVSKKDFNIKILESLVSKNEEKKKKCLDLVSNPIKTISDQVLFNESCFFLKSIIPNYKVPIQDKNPLLDALKSMNKTVSEIDKNIPNE